jgi:hypothetical protein
MAGKSSRVKGHTFERDMAKLFREMGWERCVTSRAESKSKDDQKIDLCFTDPFNVQCKAVENLGSIHRVLADMPDDTNYNIVLHKRSRSGVIVAMSLDDFKEIIKMLTINNVIKCG